MTWSRRAGVRRVGTTAAIAVVAALLQTLPARAVNRDAPEVQKTKSVPVRAAALDPAPVDVTAAAAAVPTTNTSWPAAGSATVDLPATGAAVPAGDLPVTVARPKERLLEAPSRVTVELLPQSASDAVGITGVVLRVTRADGGMVAAPVSLSLNYSSFANAVGGDWWSRLRLMEVPECTDPAETVAVCGPLAPIVTENDVVEQTLDAVFNAAGGNIGPTSSAGGTVAATSGPSGGAGDYTATSLAPSSAWQVSPQTGDFSWSYPFRVPPAMNGPAPALSINYSAGSVDGRTASTNAQPSWIGEGHSMEHGFVERRYVSCADDMTGGNNSTTKTGDQCWKTSNATISLAGRSGELIKDATTGKWRLENDDASRIELLTGGANGDNDGEYWRLTTTDGTQYYFGLQKRYATDTITTNSTLTVPVSGNHAGEPCYQTTFASSFCTQAYRWNLAYVVDPHGNTETYFYTHENNYYGQRNGAVKALYQRAAYLARIEYGERKGTEHTTNAPAMVLFTVAERCSATATACALEPTTATASNWPDVPVDQICTAAATSCSNTSPSFFTRKRLSTVTTRYWNGSAHADVDSWTLTHSYPDPGDGTSKSLWLASIQHTGKVGGTVALPAVTFTGVQRQNRVDGVDVAPPLIKWRISSIQSESGAVLTVTYKSQECVAGTNVPASPETNTKRCFPVYWTPPGYTEPVLHYFHKYVTEQVVEDDRTGAGSDKVTNYEYLSTPAWHYDDNELSQPKYRTYGDFRGFELVRVKAGAPGQEQSRTEHRFMRGMDQDRLPGGAFRDVKVVDSEGGLLEDHPRLNGFTREVLHYNGPSGALVTASLHDPWVSVATAVNGTNVATLLGTARNRSRTALAAGGVRRTDTVMTFDSYGMQVKVDDLGDVATAADDICTTTTYVRTDTATAYIADSVSTQKSVSVNCTAAPTATAAQVISDARMYYDNATVHGTAPTRGLLTKTEVLTDTPTGRVYKQKSKVVYDAHGRATETYDGLNRKSTVAFTPVTGGPVTQIVSTNALGHANTTTLHPAWGVTTAEVDANAKRTDLSYDAMGRLTSVWAPGRPKASFPSAPTARFTYTMRNDGPIAVLSEELLGNGSYLGRYQLFDGLLRLRQTQEPAPGGGRRLTDVTYDSRGLVIDRNGPYYNSLSPSATVVVVDDNQMPTQVRTTYDGASRPIAEAFRVNGEEKWRTVTTYGGDRVSVDPPAGAAPTTTVTDARGRVTSLLQYHGASPTGTADTTTYTYEPNGLIDRVTDPAGNVWSYDYDVRGRVVTTVDPDRGTTTTTYDDADQVTATTDARGQKLTFDYDLLGRRTGMRNAAGTLLAEWTFDTLTNGKGKAVAAKRHANGAVYSSEVTGYDDAYRPTGHKVVVPAFEGSLAGTYTTSLTYNSDGTVKTMAVPALGNVAGETLSFTYDALGLPRQMGAFGSSYVSETTYSPFGETLQLAMGQLNKSIWHTFFFEQGTRRLERALVDRQSFPTSDADVAYSYDAVGNVNRIADTPPNVTPDVQCFRYDYLRRLTKAWTPDTSTADCVADPAVAALGGRAPYWHSYTYDLTGNRATETLHASGGNTLREYTFPAPTQPRPHGVTSVKTTVGTNPPTTDTFDYDATGNTKTRALAGKSAQALTWDVEGRLAKVTEGTATTEYLYDADGERLIRRDPTGTTLYLDNAEIRLQSGTLNGTRYYSHNGRTIAVRTGNGLETLALDHQGTATVAVHNASMAITRRHSLPFGGERGPSVVWPGERGFVGGTIDKSTGLVHLGAREYDPANGRFISVDPLIDYNDPQQMNGYAYSNNSPVTFSDPDGLMHDSGGGGGSGSSGGKSSPPKPAPSPADVRMWESRPISHQETLETQVTVAKIRQDIQKQKVLDTVKEIVDIVSDVLGIKAAVNCFTTGDLGSCGETLVNVAMSFVGGAAAKILAKYGAPWRWKAGARLASKLWKLADRAIGAVKGWMKAGDDLKDAENSLDGFMSACKAADGPGNSFVPGTLVLLADGSTKPIEEVDVGDLVLATDPETGETGARPVTDLIVGNGVKRLVDVTVDGAVVTATANHPFWVDDKAVWLDAEDLRPGDELRVSNGRQTSVRGVATRTQVRRVHNLTVAGIHTYYVLAGSTPLLVHNCGGGVIGHGPAPENAWTTLDHIDTHGVAPSSHGLPKWQGKNRPFGNDGRNGTKVLPRNDAGGNAISYHEHDVNPFVGQNRGSERLVTGSDGSAYYTRDHYVNFVQMR